VLQALLRVKLFASPHAPAGAARKDGSAFVCGKREAIPTASSSACVWLPQRSANHLWTCRQLPAGFSVYWFTCNA